MKQINLHIKDTSFLNCNPKGVFKSIQPIFRTGDVRCDTCHSLDYIFNSAGYPKCYNCGVDLTGKVVIN